MADPYKPFTAEELDHIAGRMTPTGRPHRIDVLRLLAMARRALELESELAATKAELADLERQRVETAELADDWMRQAKEALRERDEARAEVKEARGLVAYLRQFDDGPLTRGAVADCDEFLKATNPSKNSNSCDTEPKETGE